MSATVVYKKNRVKDKRFDKSETWYIRIHWGLKTTRPASKSTQT